jgi:hypothetical protein
MDYSKAEAEFKSRANKLRSEAAREIKAAADAVNTGAASEAEFEKYMNSVLNTANSKRRALIDERKKLQAEQVLDFQRTLSGAQNAQAFRAAYDKISKLDGQKLEEEYEKSLKLGDDIAVRAAAFAGVEKGASRVVKDFAARNKEWGETLEQYQKFNSTYQDSTRKLEELIFGEYRSIMPHSVKRKPYQAGWTQDSNGRQRPYFRNRLVIDE